MQKKPGVMIYFDMLETLERLSDENAGVLLRAILEYGKTQCEPQLPDPLYLLWPMIRMRLDMDDERYYQVSQKRSYAAYVRWANHQGHAPMPYNEWLCYSEQDHDEDVSTL